MCIQFMYINNNPQEDGYRLIVTNNRDEVYQRPTKPATFWENYPNCLSGLDAQPDRENGTWFAVSKEGKIGCLLNVLTPHEPLGSKVGRGHIVVDYVSQKEKAGEYIKRLSQTDYNLFNLILMEKSESGMWESLYFTNGTDSEKHTTLLEDGIHGISNSHLDKPFQKVLKGKKCMEEIVHTYGSVDKHKELETALLQMMRDQNSTLPDAQLTVQGGSTLDNTLRKQRSSIYVYSPHIGYGTRTTTILSVSANNICRYTEYTMVEPIQTSNQEWQMATYSFPIGA